MAPIDISTIGILTRQLHWNYCQLFFRHDFRRAYLVPHRSVGKVPRWKSISCDSFRGMFWIVLSFNIKYFLTLAFQTIGLVHFRVFHYRSGA